MQYQYMALWYPIKDAPLYGNYYFKLKSSCQLQKTITQGCHMPKERQLPQSGYSKKCQVWYSQKDLIPHQFIAMSMKIKLGHWIWQGSISMDSEQNPLIWSYTNSVIMWIEGGSLSTISGLNTNQKIISLNHCTRKPMLSTGSRFRDVNIGTPHWEGMKEYIHVCMITYIYIYIFEGKMGIRTHLNYEPYLIIVQLVYGQHQKIRDQILTIRR